MLDSTRYDWRGSRCPFGSDRTADGSVIERQAEPLYAGHDILYKPLNDDGRPTSYSVVRWHLPRSKRFGKWMPKGEPPLCDLIGDGHGYALFTIQQVVGRLGPVLYLAEARGLKHGYPHKIVVAEARLLSRCTAWNDRTMRLFACDCAERAMREWHLESNHTLLEAVKTIRSFAHGEATEEQMVASGLAAWKVPSPKGFPMHNHAALAVAYASMAKIVKATPSWEAARLAIWEASWEPAGGPTWWTEGEWQGRRLLKYLELSAA